MEPFAELKISEYAIITARNKKNFITAGADCP